MLLGDGILYGEGISVFFKGFPNRFSLVRFSLPVVTVLFYMGDLY